MSDYSGLGAFVAIAGITALFFAVIAITFYVLKSIGLSVLAKNRGIENPWLAWIPVADLYILGLLVGEMDILDYHLDKLGLWVPVIFVGGSILGWIPFLGFLIRLAVYGFAVFLFYKLFEKYTPQAVVYTVLSALCLFPIFLYKIRNNQPLTGNGPSAQPPASDL